MAGRWIGAGLLGMCAGAAWGAGTPHTAAAMLHVVPPDQKLTLLRVVLHAMPGFRVAMIGLLVAITAAVVVWAVELIRLRRNLSPSLPGGLAFLSTLVVTAPLLGATIAAYDVLKVCLGLVNFRPTSDLVMLAPAFAEAAMGLFLGLLTATVAGALRGHLLIVAHIRKRLEDGV
jgi:hypothetical protein